MAPKNASADKNSQGTIKAAKPMTGSTAGTAGITANTPTLQRTEENTSPMTPKNFRNHPDMENFFRFIYENDLRHEALQIIDEIIVERQARRKKGPASANA